MCILMLCLNEKFGNKVVGKDGGSFIAEPYELGSFGSVWLYWSIVMTFFFAWINLNAVI